MTDETINESIKERELQPGDTITCSDGTEAEEYMDMLFKEGYFCYFDYDIPCKKHVIRITDKCEKLDSAGPKLATKTAITLLRDIQMQFARRNKGEPVTDVCLCGLDISAIQYGIEAIRKCQKIQEILNSASYTENGTVYSYTYDEDSRVKHIREVLKDGNVD